MSILLSGDFHANAAHELSVISKKNLVRKYGQNKYNDIRYHIILGDGGFLWPGNQGTDRYNYKTLACRPFPVLCVIGNHEPVYGKMDRMPETDIGIGETVYKIHGSPFVAYLKRGKSYTIDGFKFLVLGGALSVDRMERKLNKTWWEAEYWSEKEKEDLFSLLNTENSFDCVISHTGPHRINRSLFSPYYYDPEKFQDAVAVLNDEINSRIQFKKWWCGHWHSDVYYYDRDFGREYQYLYNTTNILDKYDNHMMVLSQNGQIEYWK
jgi:3-oxoacid CoA-transferase subunit A